MYHLDIHYLITISNRFHDLNLIKEQVKIKQLGPLQQTLACRRLKNKLLPAISNGKHSPKYLDIKDCY